MMWLDDIELDPSVSWLQMGTRSLGDRPWLVSDERRDSELSLRSDLLSNQANDVLAEPPDASPAAIELEQLVAGQGVSIADGATPLWRLGVSVQEDFCLLEPSDEGWVLRAAVLCFPSRWRLQAKVDKPLLGVHRPVEGYAETLGQRVDKLISGLGERIVLRRNWFIHPDPSLFQPDRPTEEPLIDAERCRSGLYIRSERQTLRLLPESGWCVFSIRIQHCALGQLMDRRGTQFRKWLVESSVEGVSHRGLSAAQADQVRKVLN